MSWKDALRRASFRGIAFSVLAHEAGMGRRTQVHEYPLRDKPYVEDLGRKSRTLRVDGLVLGDGYMQQRDAMINAVEVPGPGVLVHPYLGELQVSVVEFSVSESTEAGGVARFTFSFIEAGEATFPAVARNSADAVSANAAEVKLQAADAFKARYAVAGQPAQVADASAAVLTGVLQDGVSASAMAGGATAASFALARDVGRALGAQPLVVYSPADTVAAIANMLALLVDSVAATPRQALDLAEGFYSWGQGLPAVMGQSSARLQQARNQAVMLQLVRTCAVAQGAVAALQMQWPSYQDALATRDALSDAIDELAMQSTDDALYDALRSLRAAVVADITARGANLARVVSYTPGATMPALLLAHRLYADATRAQEIVARNLVAHPGFVPGGVALEVLTDG